MAAASPCNALHLSSSREKYMRHMPCVHSAHRATSRPTVTGYHSSHLLSELMPGMDCDLLRRTNCVCLSRYRGEVTQKCHLISARHFVTNHLLLVWSVLLWLCRHPRRPAGQLPLPEGLQEQHRHHPRNQGILCSSNRRCAQERLHTRPELTRQVGSRVGHQEHRPWSQDCWAAQCSVR